MALRAIKIIARTRGKAIIGMALRAIISYTNTLYLENVTCPHSWTCLLREVISPALEKSLSEDTEVAGIDKYFLACEANEGKDFSLATHHFKGSSFLARFGWSRYILRTISESDVDGLDCEAATD